LRPISAKESGGDPIVVGYHVERAVVEVLSEHQLQPLRFSVFAYRVRVLNAAGVESGPSPAYGRIRTACSRMHTVARMAVRSGVEHFDLVRNLEGDSIAVVVPRETITDHFQITCTARLCGFFDLNDLVTKFFGLFA
jgi:hypothetical protein